ncbi:MAG: methyltransferase domain-containing protein [Bdellovibrionales bacterium]|nr:methyltransferase domain-containing protein [Bdellovibrionales bacterium]
MKDAWQPDQYAKFEAERSKPFHDLAAGVGILPAGARILDLGCGTGELTATLHRKFSARETVGVELSPAMLAKSGPVAAANPGLRFVPGDLATFADDEGFDLVFANASLQWVDDHPAVLRRWRDLLRPGGKLAVQVPANQDYPTHTLCARMVAESPWREKLGEAERPPTVLKPETYATTLFGIGYRDVRVRLEVYAHVFPDRSSVVEWVKGTLLTFVRARLSDSDYSGFLDEFRARLFRELPDERPFLYPFKRILFWAWRG